MNVKHLLGLIFGVLLVSTRVEAAVLTPAIIDIELQPGQATTTQITITNTNQRFATFKTSILPFQSSDQSGVPRFYENDDQGIVRWTSTEKEFTLQPGEKKQVTVSITIPNGAETKGYYQGVFFEEVGQNPDNGVGVLQRIGTLYFINVKGETNISYKASGLTVDHGISTSLANTFRYDVDNTADYAVKPKGDLRIKSFLGVRNEPVNPLGMRLLPKEKREIITGIGNTNPKSMIESLKNEWKYFSLGVVNVELSLDGVDQVLEASYFVLPIITLSITSVLILVLFGLYKWYRYVNRTI